MIGRLGELLTAPWTAIGAAALAVVLGAESFFVPRVADLDAVAQPVSLPKGTMELVLFEPVLGHDGVLLYGGSGEDFALDITRARFSTATLQDELQIEAAALAAPGRISYGTAQEETDGTTSCTVNVEVAPADPAQPPSQLRLAAPGGWPEGVRVLEAKAEGGDMRLTFQSVPEPEDDAGDSGPLPSCVRWLRKVADLNGEDGEAAGGAVELNSDVEPPFRHEIEVEAGGVVQVRIPAGKALSVPIFPDEFTPLRARQIEVQAAPSGPAAESSAALLWARGDSAQVRLTIQPVELGAEDLRVTIQDRGIVGGPWAVGASRWQYLRRHKVGVAVVIGFDLASLVAIGLLWVRLGERNFQKERPAPGGGPFDVFLSHNSKDKPVVRRLAQALVKRGVKVWLDEWELLGGRSWQQGIETGIRDSRTAAVLVGRRGLGSWERAEMEVSLNGCFRSGKPVIPVLLPGAPHEPDLSPLLKTLHAVDLRKGLRAKGLDRLVRDIRAGSAPAGDGEGGANGAVDREGQEEA